MSARTENQLYLHEELLLLALQDEAGVVDWRAGQYIHAVGGAILMELMMAERLALDESGRKPMVEVADETPTGDPLLDEVLEKIRTAKRRAGIQTWVARIGQTPQLKHSIAKGLCELGILEEQTGKVLFIFSQKIYPERDAAPETEIVERLRAAIFDEAAEMTERTALLVALANAAGMLAIHFDRKELKKQKLRLKAIEEREHVAQATKQAIAAAQAAVIASTTAATTAATMAAVS
jgi:Golgi phosphoprotein 3